jgi:hypothetical protein
MISNIVSKSVKTAGLILISMKHLFSFKIKKKELKIKQKALQVCNFVSLKLKQ